MCMYEYVHEWYVCMYLYVYVCITVYLYLNVTSLLVCMAPLAQAQAYLACR
jgi:hypothetical protein